MTRVAAKTRALAEQLIAYEGKHRKRSASKTTPALIVCDKLRPHLATFMGSAGFHGLLSRAIALSAVEVPWLKSMRLELDGSLAGADALLTQISVKEFTDGSVTVTAQLLALLGEFIGENLTLRLINQVWPKFHFNGSNLDQGKSK